MGPTTPPPVPATQLPLVTEPPYASAAGGCAVAAQLGNCASPTSLGHGSVPAFPSLSVKPLHSLVARSRRAFVESTHPGGCRCRTSLTAAGVLHLATSGTLDATSDRLCRHPKDRVPLHISSKSRQRARRVSTRCHATIASDHTSL
jgi:hypothetical protein